MSIVDRLAEECAGEHPDIAAQVLEQYTPEEAARALQGFTPELAARVVDHMDGWYVSRSIAVMETPHAAATLLYLDDSDAPPLLRRLPPEVRERIMADIPEDRARAWNTRLRFPENTAGALMDPFVVSCADDNTVVDALESVRREPTRASSSVYVTRRDHQLVGVVGIPELIASDPETPVRDLMSRTVARLQVGDTRQTIVAHPGWRDYANLPVVRDRRLVGLLRYETWRALQQDDDILQPSQGVGFAASFSELAWLGLAGVTRGIGHVAVQGIEAQSIEAQETES